MKKKYWLLLFIIYNLKQVRNNRRNKMEFDNIFKIVSDVIKYKKKSDEKNNRGK